MQIVLFPFLMYRKYIWDAFMGRFKEVVTCYIGEKTHSLLSPGTNFTREAQVTLFPAARSSKVFQG